MTQAELKILLDKYTAGTLNTEEQSRLDQWYLYQAKHSKSLADAAIYEKRMRELDSAFPFETKLKTTKLWPRIAGIAAAVIGLAICVYLFTVPRHPDASLSSRANAKDLNDIAPGGNRATLTAANGNTINLSEKQSGLAIDATAISYNDGTKIDPSSLGMTNGMSSRETMGLSLEVSVPRGGTYSVILQDGTKVWLNADSKLEFYSDYGNKLQRIVKLIGEGYFEVARDKTKPFIVESNGQQVTVLGTHFNISAYKGEGIRTTLVEGSVRVRIKGEAVTLKPNQQANTTGSNITVRQVDATEVTAWKNGKFVFNSDDINGLMQQVARWYNVEVVYQDNVQDIKVTGSVSRFANITTLLDKLGQTGSVKFKLEGRTVTVMKAK